MQINAIQRQRVCIANVRALECWLRAVSGLSPISQMLSADRGIGDDWVYILTFIVWLTRPGAVHSAEVYFPVGHLEADSDYRNTP